MQPCDSSLFKDGVQVSINSVLRQSLSVFRLASLILTTIESNSPTNFRNNLHTDRTQA
jgi:hypothetical protein